MTVQFSWMALFDRRLLSYFDDGGTIGSGTFQDRICDYQQDLCDIERELLKYQHLLGIQRVKVKARDRRHWKPATRAVREDGAETDLGSVQNVVTQPHQAEHRSSFSLLEPPASTASHSSSVHGRQTPSEALSSEAKRGSRRLSKADGPGVEKPVMSGSVTSHKAHAADASTDTRRSSVQGKRLSVRSEQPTASPTTVRSAVSAVPAPPTDTVGPAVPAAVSAQTVQPQDTFLERMTSLEPANCVTHWAQVDTVFLSPQQAVSPDEKFLVRAMWLGKEKVVQTGSQKELSPNDSVDFPWRCKVREQLKLEAAPDVRVIVLHIIQLTQGAEKVLGSVMLDALDSKNHAETVQEALYDPRGHRLESYLKVKLATATPASAVSAVSVPVIQQDPVAVRAVPVPAAVPDVKSGAHSEPQAEEADDEEVELVYEEDPEEEPADDDPEEEV